MGKFKIILGSVLATLLVVLIVVLAIPTTRNMITDELSDAHYNKYVGEFTYEQKETVLEGEDGYTGLDENTIVTIVITEDFDVTITLDAEEDVTYEIAKENVTRVDGKLQLVIGEEETESFVDLTSKDVLNVSLFDNAINFNATRVVAE